MTTLTGFPHRDRARGAGSGMSGGSPRDSLTPWKLTIPANASVPVHDDVSKMLANRVSDRAGVAAAALFRRPAVGARAMDVASMAAPATIAALESGRPWAIATNLQGAWST